jgi:peptidoglycan L-alanyl-D-glutamate endopeptidase CwlK
MPSFGATSRQRLEGVHPDLVAIAEDVVEVYDITVLDKGGVRKYTEQRELVLSGASKTMDSKHLKQVDGYGHALDIAPYPVDWDDSERFFFMAGLVMMAAKKRGVKVRWGHDWDQDMDFNDQKFNDSPHFELVI